jgi:hypothetical protein
MGPAWQKREICGYLMGFNPFLVFIPGRSFSSAERSNPE